MAKKLSQKTIDTLRKKADKSGKSYVHSRLCIGVVKVPTYRLALVRESLWLLGLWAE